MRERGKRRGHGSRHCRDGLRRLTCARFDSREGLRFARTGPRCTRRNGITDAVLAHCQAAHPAPGEGDGITKEDLFHCIDGLRHVPDQRGRYVGSLAKELRRIPVVQGPADFQSFTQEGLDLSPWHLNHQTVATYPGARLDTGKATIGGLTDADYRATKFRFGKGRDASGKSVPDKPTVHENEVVAVTNMSLEAFGLSNTRSPRAVEGRAELAKLHAKQRAGGRLTADERSRVGQLELFARPEPEL